ncbi:hypothetical protein GGTG_00938 [Gaeumannomyces tritici R3-111a-1]|uniref:Uncharacterized protein n=1 Tax=Gaeumannomyces tritici (strain R3-111a-1) TaxID=644352 RepID=J3NI55_GAET3|nr:hypothetical protein GGTG_00938 [Gaeumannomyces tritici R3-111a-1]EJT80948.1 hypothetical protein GGTG_00938 [Gaeumannomyces tritici R3-111a-1]
MEAPGPLTTQDERLSLSLLPYYKGVLPIDDTGRLARTRGWQLNGGGRTKRALGQASTGRDDCMPRLQQASACIAACVSAPGLHRPSATVRKARATAPYPRAAASKGENAKHAFRVPRPVMGRRVSSKPRHGQPNPPGPPLLCVGSSSSRCVIAS